jgi:hypothetical protein
MVDGFKETHEDYVTTLDVSNSLKGAYLSVICLTMLSLAKPTKHLLVGCMVQHEPVKGLAGRGYAHM